MATQPFKMLIGGRHAQEFCEVMQPRNTVGDSLPNLAAIIRPIFPVSISDTDLNEGFRMT